jgi:pimeloyl-ACP methyl ester carboxylesterase
MRLEVEPGLTIALHDLGGEGGPLLLAHATGFHGIAWRPFAAELADAWHSWAIDFKGHGDSPLPAGYQISWERFGDDVLAAVDAIGGGPLVAAGHSKGGAALLTAEERRPGTFAGLWLYEPIVVPPFGERPAGENPLAAGAARRRAGFASRDEAVANYAGKPPLNVLRPDALEAYVEHGFADVAGGGITLKCRPEVEAAVYAAGPAASTWERLGDVRCPVVIAAGGDGPPAMMAPAIAERLPDGRLATYPDLGHFGPLQDPARLAADAREFFNSIRG